MPNELIYIVEDDKFYAEYIRYAIKLSGNHSVEIFDNAKDFLKQMHRKPAVVSLDYGLPDANGEELLKKVKAMSPETTVFVVSGQEDVETAMKLLHSGAKDYIVKNGDTKNKIVHCVNECIRQQANGSGTLRMDHREAKDKFDPERLILSNDQSMQKVYHMIHKAAKSSINVSILGETGTGKELVATAVHHNSDRSKQPFVAINLAAIPEGLIESELFGHEKGAFTNAVSKRKGKIDQAGKGTLFLDEISEVPMQIQVKLLRVLQEREYSPLGSNAVLPVNCRIICATNKDLQTEVAAGRFREDLFYRLVGIPVSLPKLTSRGKDLQFLAQHFAQEFAAEQGLEVLGFSDAALSKLRTHSWPGNVRELKATVELACVLSEGKYIREEDLLFNGVHASEPDIPDHLSLKEINEQIIFKMLDKYDNNVRHVANILEIGKSTIYRLLKEREEQKEPTVNVAS